MLFNIKHCKNSIQFFSLLIICHAAVDSEFQGLLEVLLEVEEDLTLVSGSGR